jgi:hypothetical protein
MKIADQLIAAGRSAVLYPNQDAADVGVDGLSIGIDAKSYSSPLALASRLSRSVGRLDLFSRRIIAIPDYKLKLNPDYIVQLRTNYTGDTSLEFMTTSQVIATLTQ